MENAIEQVLKEHGARGLSIKQLKNVTGLSRKEIMYRVYTSNYIENTNPWIHGSGKSRIRVFNYTPLGLNYFKRKEKKLVITFESES